MTLFVSSYWVVQRTPTLSVSPDLVFFLVQHLSETPTRPSAGLLHHPLLPSILLVSITFHLPLLGLLLVSHSFHLSPTPSTCTEHPPFPFPHFPSAQTRHSASPQILPFSQTRPSAGLPQLLSPPSLSSAQLPQLPFVPTRPFPPLPHLDQSFSSPPPLSVSLHGLLGSFMFCLGLTSLLQDSHTFCFLKPGSRLAHNTFFSGDLSSCLAPTLFWPSDWAFCSPPTPCLCKGTFCLHLIPSVCPCQAFGRLPKLLCPPTHTTD